MTTVDKFAYVKFDLSTAETERAIRDKLIELGWTPPKQEPCKDLSNAERESLLAENAMKREALEEIYQSAYRNAFEARKLNKHELNEFIDMIGVRAKQALSTTPRLLEVGVTRAYKSVDLVSLPDGTKLYTIQKGE